MKILILNVQDDCTRKDVISFVSAALRGPWYQLFRPTGEIVDVDVLRMTDHQAGTVEYHAIADVEPTRVAWEVVRQLNGSKFRGRQVRVRKWFDRTGPADRRLYYKRGGDGKLMERRSGDDRRRDLEIESAKSLKVRAVDGFQREHHG